MNMFVTVLKMRAPGLTWTRLPVFVWSTVLSTLLGLVVFPAFTAAALLTLLDRVFGTSFYQAAFGGSNFVYEQLFWFMGHPEVYVILLPAVGAVCEVVTVFARKPLFGYKLVVGGMIGIFVLSLTVWMHHLYWSGANTSLDTPIMLDTELISIPTGLVFFALIGTLWRGRIRLEPPMLFALGFVVNFLIGGVTGLYLADVPTDTMFHGDMFTVAHFHFTLVGGSVFGFLAGLLLLVPEDDRAAARPPALAKLHFWLFEIGFLGVFLPLFYAGIKGEPRWQAFVDPKFGTANLISSLFVILDHRLGRGARLQHPDLVDAGYPRCGQRVGWPDARVDASEPGAAGQLRAARGRVGRSVRLREWAARGRWGPPRSPEPRGRRAGAGTGASPRRGRAGRPGPLGRGAARSSRGRCLRCSSTSPTSTWTRSTPRGSSSRPRSRRRRPSATCW